MTNTQEPERRKISLARHRKGLSIHVEVYFDPAEVSAKTVAEEAHFLAYDIEDKAHDIIF